MSEKDLLNEVWKQIEGYPNYEVSNMGRVRSLNYYGKTGRVQILKLNDNGNGYQKIYLCNDGKKRKLYVHRLVWEAFRGKIPEGYELDHINTKRCDSRLENLRCVTPKENRNNPTTRKKYLESMEKMHQSQEWKKKNAEAMKKLWSDTDWKKKNAEAMKKLHSDPEYKKKLAERMKKLNQSPEFRKKTNEAARKASAKSVVQLDKNTGEVIRRWDCIACVEREIGVHKESISECCRGNNKTAGGYKWRFYTPPAVIYQPEFMKYFE